MLIDSKPKLQQDIYDILKKSMYEAYMSTFDKDADINSVIKNRVKNDMMDTAKKYAETFANTACEPMAEAIYEFVKSIGIIATPTSLVSPHGPVTGAINANDHKIL